jgi:hypothetical protein
LIQLTRIFTYLDRTYVLQNIPEKSLWGVGLKEFCKIIVSIQVKKTLLNKILVTIEMERNGNSIEKDYCKKLIKMYHFLGIYEIFEELFLDETRSFYQKEAILFVNKMNLSDYLHHTIKRIKQEEDRVENYLEVNTKKLLIKITQEKLIKDYDEFLINKGFTELLDRTSTEDLNILYKLFKAVESSNMIKVNFCNYITFNGCMIINDEENDGTMIETLIKFKEKIDNIYLKGFEKDENFLYDYKLSFEKFLNSRESTPPQLIAKFLNSKLISGKN